jgi:hypothetical protein
MNKYSFLITVPSSDSCLMMALSVTFPIRVFLVLQPSRTEVPHHGQKFEQSWNSISYPIFHAESDSSYNDLYLAIAFRDAPRMEPPADEKDKVS